MCVCALYLQDAFSRCENIVASISSAAHVFDICVRLTPRQTPADQGDQFLWHIFAWLSSDRLLRPPETNPRKRSGIWTPRRWSYHCYWSPLWVSTQTILIQYVYRVKRQPMYGWYCCNFFFFFSIVILNIKYLVTKYAKARPTYIVRTRVITIYFYC